MLPQNLSALWSYFLELSHSEINYQEVKAWMDCTGRDLDPWECKAIIELHKAREIWTCDNQNNKI